MIYLGGAHNEIFKKILENSRRYRSHRTYDRRNILYDKI